MRFPILLLASVASLVLSCRAVKPEPAQADELHATPPGADGALRRIDAADLMRHIQTLASDEYEGRGVGTHGEDLEKSTGIPNGQAVRLLAGERTLVLRERRMNGSYGPPFKFKVWIANPPRSGACEGA